MTNANSSGRPVAPETVLATRAEPRIEPRPPAAPRSSEPRGPEARAADGRTAEGRTTEGRAAEVRAGDPAPRVSVLGPSLKFRGELSAQEDLIVQGSVEGSITHTQSLTVGTEGSMKGDIRARVIVVDGKVEGDLYATESVNIRATAKVKGNVFAPRIGIAEGAMFQGQIDMQASGAAVQAQSVRMREAASAPTVAAATVDKILSGG